MRITIVILMAGVLACSAAQAEVVSQTAAGFDIEQRLSLKAEPAKVYDALTDIGRWWNPQHSYSGEAARLHLDARAGGCFCETLADGGSVQHATVIFADRPKLLRLAGALGPLQTMGVSAVLDWALQPTADGTALLMHYRVGGYASTPFEVLAPAVDAVLDEQMQRLKSYVETGKP
ncbi:SRPBCC family protein [Solimonas terrae]|nr:SRPBCC domain-containing protein [Solimonas terrae]